MKPHSSEQLVDAMAQEIAWRKRELAVLRALVEAARTRKNQQSVLTRSAIAVLYAHWEGFVKQAATLYLHHVALQRVPYNVLTANFVALGMKSKFQAAQYTTKASVLNNVALFFLSGLSETCRIPYDTIVNTKSNLSSAVFREIVHTLNLDYSAFATKEKLIDQSLVNSRNHIAHGEFLDVDIDGYLELETQVLGMMEELRTQIENASLLKRYLRDRAETSTSA